MRDHGSRAWLVSTGWTEGGYGTGHRINLPHTRSIIDAIHSGELNDVETTRDEYFGLEIPTSCPASPTRS